LDPGTDGAIEGPRSALGNKNYQLLDEVEQNIMIGREQDDQPGWSASNQQITIF
jgi:hypothetical protein